jgi:hypothetical protein
MFLEGSDGFVTSTAASIATGWSDPVAGRELHPLKIHALSRRTIGFDRAETRASGGAPRPRSALGSFDPATLRTKLEPRADLRRKLLI